MKLQTLVAVFALSAAASIAAQDQEIRIVTAESRTPLPPGAAGIQPMKLGTGVIFGQITEADSNRPVAGAIVTINLPGVQPLRVMADAQGRFGFRDLPAGGFNITASRPGWVDGTYGRTRPGGPGLPLRLTDGERVSGVVIPVWRYASISGTVVDESGDPIVNAPVRALRRSTIGGRTRLTMGSQDTTDDRGMYRISMLEPGDYVVAVPMQRNPSDIAPMIAERQMAEVMAVRATAVAAGGDMVFFSAAGGGTPAGIGEDGRPLAYPTVFYPNVTTSSRSTLITVSSGEERPSVDFQLRGMPTSRVSGVATGPDGAVPNLQLTLVPAEAGEMVSPIETLSGGTDGQGRFTVEGVPPGQYVLRAVRTPRVAMGPGEVTTITQGDRVVVTRTLVSASGFPPLPTDPTLWAEMTLTVGAKDLADIPVSLHTGIRVTGMVQFNGGAERPAADRLNSIGITLEPADPQPGVPAARGRIESTGVFATMGVPPGRYFVRVNGSYPGWTLHSVQVGGRDASVVAIDLESSDLSGATIVFTDRPSELSGQVQADGPLDAATVLVFPAESSAWVGYGTASRRFANARADKQGNFRVTNLPAGDYLAVAIPDRMANDWQNPKFLESLVAEATRVRIGDGDKATASLKVAR